jgi:hypothetical protein
VLDMAPRIGGRLLLVPEDFEGDGMRFFHRVNGRGSALMRHGMFFLNPYVALFCLTTGVGILEVAPAGFCPAMHTPPLFPA